MPPVVPSSAQELACVLADAAAAKRSVFLYGNNSKQLMAGPVTPAEISVSTAALKRILQYESNDLTISVEAGLRFAALQSLLEKSGQMIALDPPHWYDSTVGGIVASNSSGSMRRAFGTARDLIIGLEFATLEGKLVRSGGMVVKNVAGLDMAKLMIGSFGTLAAVTSVNLRVHSLPEQTRTFLLAFREVDQALGKRDALLRSVLKPTAIDLLSPPASARLGQRGYVLAVRAGGSAALLDRYQRELSEAEVVCSPHDQDLWQRIREFTPEFLKRQPGGVVLRISTTLNAMSKLLKLVSGPSISRAGSGVTCVYLSSWQSVSLFWRAAIENGWTAVVEYASHEIRRSNELWLTSKSSGRQNALEIMDRFKQTFDPDNLLNHYRLYGRI